MALQEAVNRARLRAWAAQPASFWAQTARIDADATIVPTGAEAKAGIDIAYNGVWGYSALLVSLANTAEPLYLALHGANRPSHEGVVPLYDRAIALCRQAGFPDILLRGDTDFSLTTELDRWSSDGVRFVFGYNAWASMLGRAGAVPDEAYHELVARAERAIKTRPRARPANAKDAIVRARRYKVLRQKHARRGQLLLPAGQVQKGLPGRRPAQGPLGRAGRGRAVQRVPLLLLHHQRLGADRRPGGRRGPTRCNQENLIAQLKGGVRALHAPVNTLNANWAYMAMAAPAWSIKAWCAHLLPVEPPLGGPAQRPAPPTATDGFPYFPTAFIEVPCQVVKGARQVRWRVQSWNPWLGAFFRLLDAL